MSFIEFHGEDVEVRHAFCMLEGSKNNGSDSSQTLAPIFGGKNNMIF